MKAPAYRDASFERIVLLDAGRVVAEGDVSAVLSRDVLEPVYGPNGERKEVFFQDVS